MSRHSVEIPHDLEAKARARAQEAGYETIEEYLESLLHADVAGETFGAPDSVRVDNQDQLEAMLEQRLNDPRPSIDATPQFWDDLRRRADDRVGRKETE